MSQEHGKENNVCSCGRPLQYFMHNCISSDMPEIYGCPYCEDNCPLCLDDKSKREEQ